MRVLVSGAGISGPCFSYFAAKAGARVTVLEKASSFLAQGQNIDIDGAAITVMEKMGLMDELRRYNTTEKGTKFIDSKGRSIAPLPVTGPSPTSEFEILRGDLANVLYEATKNHPNISYLLGTTIKQVITNDDRAVKVELSNGETHEFDILVAADGQWSRVRRQIFSPESVKVVDKGMYASYWTAPRLSSDDDWWNVYLALESRAINLRPDPYGTIRAMFSYMPCNEAQKKEWDEAVKSDKQTQQQLLKREFADAGWQAQRLLDTMDQAPDFYFQKVQQIRMSKWSKSRIICLGDSAYCPTPLTGMGASLALIGAYVLAGELSNLKDGEHPSNAFESYETAFRPFVEKIQDLPSFVPGIAHPKTASGRWLLQTSLRTMSKVVSVPWIGKTLSKAGGENVFPLAPYPSFDNEKAIETGGNQVVDGAK